MTVQLSLIQDDTIKKSIITVPIDQLRISPFNPRSTRDDADIDKLAERISRNGFEITRALWAYQNGSGYEVFAGGNRLEAAKRAAVENVPIVLHEGLEDQDIVRLAYEDNENDEYHKEVSPVDVWASYAELIKKGWTQQQIADAVGGSQTRVSKRLTLHSLSDTIKEYMRQEKINEEHLMEITPLCVDAYFLDWLTTEQAWEELAAKAVKDKSKNGSKSVEAVKKDVKQWKKFVEEAKAIYQSFQADVTLYAFETMPPQSYTFNAQLSFVNELRKRGARSLAKVKEAERAVKIFIKDNLEQYALYASQESKDAADKAAQAQKEQRILAKFIKGDCLTVLDDWQYGPIKLLLTDPPYGMDYQTNRRWASKPPDKIQGDDKAVAIELIKNALSKSFVLLADDAHILIFCGWENEPIIRELITECGLKIKGSLIWAKEEHTAGDVKGSFGPSHERIIHAVKGSPEVTPRIRDVIECNRANETSHPNEKPTELLEKVIKSTTNEGDLVVDLFAGVASTLIAAMRTGRDFIGVEIIEDYHDEGVTRLLQEIKKDA